MSESRYRQCQFERLSETDRVIKTSGWIPERHKGIKIEPGVQVMLNDGVEPWIVTTVSETSISKESAKLQERRHLKHREGSDI